MFRTHDEQEQRLVAVKAFTLDITPERAEELSSHLQQVVEIDLEHPHIARPIATGVEDSVAYLAEQYVAGESLDAALRQYGPAPANDVLRLIGHVAEALDVAACVGVFHGSLHPRDILVTPGETHITGLGVSTALERIGQHGPIRRPYAAPERESGQEWGAAADVFSLAVITYEVLTGRRALPGTEQPLPGLSDLEVHDGAALRELLEAAIDPQPERRPATAREFVSALAATLIETGSAQAPGERGGGSRRKIKPRAPKLPGLDDPLIPPEAATAEPPAPAGGSEPPLAVEIVMPAAPTEYRYEPAIDWDGAVAESDYGVDAAVPLQPDVIAPEPEAPLVAEPSERPGLRMRPTPHAEDLAPVFSTPAVAPPRAEPHEADIAVPPSLFAWERADRLSATPRSAGPDRSVDGARDGGPLGRDLRDLAVPRAIDPTRGGESFSPPSRRVEPVPASQQDRVYAPIAIAAAAGLLLGLLGGFEIGARWGQSTPATAVATKAAPAGEPAGPPAAAAPPLAASAPSPSPAPLSGTASPAVTAPAASPAAGQPAAARPAAAAPAAVPAPAKRTAAPPAVPADITPPKSAVKKPVSAPVRETAPGASQASSIYFASRPPGARVILDGKDVGLTPFTMSRAAPGNHTIALRLAGYRPWTTSITVEAGKPLRVTASLERNVVR